jgi:hypothetical protein
VCSDTPALTAASSGVAPDRIAAQNDSRTDFGYLRPRSPRRRTIPGVLCPLTPRVDRLSG